MRTTPDSCTDLTLPRRADGWPPGVVALGFAPAVNAIVYTRRNMPIRNAP